MVRTYPVASLHFDPARVAARSAAIALHLLAFLLLLIPATYQAVQAPREKTTVRLIEKIPQRRRPRCWNSPGGRPGRTEATDAAGRAAASSSYRNRGRSPGIALPAAEPAPPQLAPSIDTSAPLAGAQLQYRSAPPPAYPLAALRNREQGTVLLRVEVDTRGQPTGVSIERSSGSRSWTRPRACRCSGTGASSRPSVMAWRYRPSAWCRCSSRCRSEVIAGPATCRAGASLHVPTDGTGSTVTD